MELFGKPTVIDERLFLDGAGQLKITKRGREQYVMYLAETILSPDEIYEAVEAYRLKAGETLTRRRFLKTFAGEGGDEFYSIVVFTWDAEQKEYVGTTAFIPFDEAGAADAVYFEKQKTGISIPIKK